MVKEPDMEGTSAANINMANHQLGIRMVEQVKVVEAGY
jgi:hypothetical protein